ncbi:hypothetical protein PHISCL_05450 [Aspergillus sclerotialis]|uniref:Zn(2)-C6 fungal-type domain-containing protein n=1 Tax=Aspergillus sclerotialis TaxID=2070753 RepID=A0A3A2ZGH3_9EURO|nr:hypothetical protein PHISCL_05450 [Aspergillus sclerotialis]
MSRSFRPKLACVACTRKKIKCNKLVPCDNCIKRGQPELCVRETGNDEGAPTDVDSVAVQSESATTMISMSMDAQQRMAHLMQGLLGRIEQLEANQQQHLQRTPQPEQRPRTNLTTPESHNDSSLPGMSTRPPGTDQAVGAHALPCTATASSMNQDCLESMLGEESGLSQLKGNQLSLLQLLIPHRQQVEHLVNYHTESLLWSHGGYHAPSFHKELVRFYDLHRGQLTSSGLDLQWVALLFSILSGSVISAPSALTVDWGFRIGEQCIVSERWYDATLECLQLSQYLSYHRLYSLQAIVVLSNSAYMLGRMRSQNVLIATGIRIAQNLGLHQLGGEEAYGVSEGLVTREIGRRVWFALIRQDYFFIPFTESYFLRPIFNKTEKPRNCRDDEMVSLPDAVPTVMSYCRFMDKIAALMPELHDSFNAATTPYTQYEEIIQFDAKMRSLATIHRPIFFTECPLDESWPKYIAWARRALTISFAHKVIMIHRKMLGRSMVDPIFSFTRKTCVSASKTIIKTLQHPGEANRPILWIEQAFTVTAGVILCFDMLYRSPLDSEMPPQQHRTVVEEAISTLRQVDQCIIARKGARLLSVLLQEVQHGRPYATRNKRKLDEADSSHNNVPQSQFLDVESFVQSFWKRQSEKNMTPVGPTPVPQTPPSSWISNAPWESDDIQGFLADFGLFGSTAVGVTGEEPVATIHTVGEQMPSFEDLLFRAENFEF